MIRSNRKKRSPPATSSNSGVDGNQYGDSLGSDSTTPCAALSELAIRASSLLSQVTSPFSPPSSSTVAINEALVSASKQPVTTSRSLQKTCNTIPTMIPFRQRQLVDQKDGGSIYHGFDLSLVNPTNGPSSPVATRQSNSIAILEGQPQQYCSVSVNNNSDMTFPQKLMQILSDVSVSDVISWLSHGQAFVILRPRFLVEYVLPNYFGRAPSSSSKRKVSLKYSSFTRKLNRWGFRVINEGPDTGAFHHHLFCREKPELCTQMIQQTKPGQRRKGENVEDSAGLPLKKRFKSIKQAAAMSKTGSRSALIASSDGETVSTERSSSPTSSLTMTMSDSSSGTSGTASRQSPEGSSPPTTSNTIPNDQLKNKQVVDSAVVIDPAFVTQSRSNQKVVSADNSVTSDALRRRNQLEIVRASKEMLRHAYMEALKKEE